MEGFRNCAFHLRRSPRRQTELLAVSDNVACTASPAPGPFTGRIHSLTLTFHSDFEFVVVGWPSDWNHWCAVGYPTRTDPAGQASDRRLMTVKRSIGGYDYRHIAVGVRHTGGGSWTFSTLHVGRSW